MYQHRATKTKAGLAAIAFLLITLVPMWGTLHAWLDQENVLVEKAAGSDAMNLAVAFDVHVQSVVRFVDTLTQDLREHAVKDRNDFGRIVKEELVLYGSMVAQVALISPEGMLVYSSLAPALGAVDLSGRDHFRVHRDNPSIDKLFISKPVFGRVSGVWSIQFTRPIIEGDSFSGVVVVSIPMYFFSDFYKKINVGAHGLIALVGMDRAPRAVASKDSGTINVDELLLSESAPYFGKEALPEGLYRGVSAFDGSESLTAYRRLEDAGLVVLVQLSPEDYLMSSGKRYRVLIFFASAVTILLLSFALLIYSTVWQHLKDAKALKQAHKTLRELVNVDILTGALSRSHFLEVLEKEFRDSESCGTKLSLILIDIDYFKQVNDTYGHPIGDIVLKQVVAVCCAELRAHDSFGRLGGEEFGVILPCTDGASAVGVAEKLRLAIECAKISTSKGLVRVTVSMGVAFALPSGDTPSKLVVRADDALYCAKQAGRNRVCSARGNDDASQVTTLSTNDS